MRTRSFDFQPIRQAFGFSEAADAEAAQQLARILASTPYQCEKTLARMRIEDATVHILGAANHARMEAERIPRSGELWTADGATTAALEADRNPTAIVTDLDGRVDDEIEAAERGSTVIIHAHGDNREALARWVPEFPPERVAGTCQVKPVPPLINPGGFTDGDRAVFLALQLGAASVLLYGFDFEHPGAYSGSKQPENKRLKLTWARRLIDGLIADGAPVRFA